MSGGYQAYTPPQRLHSGVAESYPLSNQDQAMRLLLLPLGVLLASAAGCAGHSTMYGTVVMRLNETEAHVCLQEGSVAEGDRVQLVRHVCDNPSEGRSAARQCHPTIVGEGVVESLLNEHYSLVRFPAELAVREGDTVQPVAD